jgi:hypothetical protein
MLKYGISLIYITVYSDAPTDLDTKIETGRTMQPVPDPNSRTFTLKMETPVFADASTS